MTASIEYKLGELTGKVEGVGKSITEIKDFMKKYDERIASLETSRNQQLGAFTVLSTFISFFMMLVGSVVQKTITGWIK